MIQKKIRIDKQRQEREKINQIWYVFKYWGNLGEECLGSLCTISVTLNLILC